MSIEQIKVLKLGFLLSAGGSAFAEAVKRSRLPRESCHVVTDRYCGAIEKADSLGITNEIVCENERLDFSKKAHAAFRASGCDFIVMQFSRLVSAYLYDHILTINLHPSLLPAFPGLSAVGKAHSFRSPIQGATLHIADSGVDTGPVLAQTVMSVPLNISLEQRLSIAFRQKVVLLLALIDWMQAGRINPASIGLDAFNLTGLQHSTVCSPSFETDDAQRQAQKALNPLLRAEI